MPSGGRYTRFPAVKGEIFSICTIPNPGAGNNLDYELHTNNIMRLLMWTGKFATSAVVANRTLRLGIEIDCGAPFRYQFDFTTVIPANKSARWHLGLGDPANNYFTNPTATMRYRQGMPDLILPPDTRIYTDIDNIDAADLITEICFLAQIWRP